MSPDSALTLEKMKVNERLGVLEVSITSLKDSTEKSCNDMRLHAEESHSAMKENIDKLNKIIIGNGQKGLAESVRHLENREAVRDRHIFAVWAGVIGLMAKVIWEIVTKSI